MSRESVPEKIEEQVHQVELEASRLVELFARHGYGASEVPIHIACDEVRDDLANVALPGFRGEAESDEGDSDD